ncbi:MAG: DUF4474 domain-containing protein [Candidatus Coprovivens sp.]
MLLLWLIFLIPFILVAIKITIYLIFKKYGKISYKGFSALGFAYDNNKDIFYTVKNAWQKNFGYSHFYDVMAPIFQMIIDTEPIKFYYNNKNWLISFWKGQYGMVTGSEIGIYATSQKRVNKKTIYLPIEDKDMLDIDMILYKNNKIIARISAKHWWLAIFKLGIFSNPKELSMDINITFPNKDMLNAFTIAFRKKGYKENDYRIIDNTFCFHYTKPKTHKVWTRGIISDYIRQSINKNNVRLYNKYIEDNVDYNNSCNDNKLIINDLIPDILKNTEDKKIVDNVISDKNVLLLRSDLSPSIGVNKDD